MDKLIDDLRRLAESLEQFADDTTALAYSLDDSLYYTGFCLGQAQAQRNAAKWLRQTIEYNEML